MQKINNLTLENWICGLVTRKKVILAGKILVYAVSLLISARGSALDTLNLPNGMHTTNFPVASCGGIIGASGKFCKLWQFRYFLNNFSSTERWHRYSRDATIFKVISVAKNNARASSASRIARSRDGVALRRELEKYRNIYTNQAKNA
jgi:hypothetical protein